MASKDEQVYINSVRSGAPAPSRPRTARSATCHGALGGNQEATAKAASRGLLTDRFIQPCTTPELYVRSVNGVGGQLLDRQTALALFEQQPADPWLRVTGHPDTPGGYSWQVHGAIPPRIHTVRPVALPPRPGWPGVLGITIVLVFLTADRRRRERRFHVDVIVPLDAYNVACCLWSGRETGRGATAAVLIDDSDGRVYPISEPANSCTLLPRTLIDKIVASSAPTPAAASSQTGAPGGEVVPPYVSPRQECLPTRAGRQLVDPHDEPEPEGTLSAPPAANPLTTKDSSMDHQAEELDKRAAHAAISMALIKGHRTEHRTSGPMVHATGENCSPVPLARLRDLAYSLRDLPNDRKLYPLASFDGFSASADIATYRARLTEELRSANRAGREAAAAERS